MRQRTCSLVSFSTIAYSHSRISFRLILLNTFNKSLNSSGRATGVSMFTSSSSLLGLSYVQHIFFSACAVSPLFVGGKYSLFFLENALKYSRIISNVSLCTRSLTGSTIAESTEVSASKYNKYFFGKNILDPYPYSRTYLKESVKYPRYLLKPRSQKQN